MTEELGGGDNQNVCRRRCVAGYSFTSTTTTTTTTTTTIISITTATIPTTSTTGTTSTTTTTTTITSTSLTAYVCCSSPPLDSSIAFPPSFSY